jgi:hypothetical protein
MLILIKNYEYLETTKHYKAKISDHKQYLNEPDFIFMWILINFIGMKFYMFMALKI